jgi:hypothetical protein
MRFHTTGRLMFLAALAAFVGIQAFGQGPRGSAELKTAGGSITLDYGKPALQGRDMLSQLQVGMFWRMGSNMATVIKTPVDLNFGSVRILKGNYSLWLEKIAGEKFQLVFNSLTGEWGTEHDPQKDVAKVALIRDTLSSPVEVLTLDLKEAANGGTFQMSWGTTKLSADFKAGK